MDLPDPGIEQGFLHCRWILYQLSYQGSANTVVFSIPWKTVWRFLKKLKIQISFTPSIYLLSIYSKELTSGSRGGIGTAMFTEALFTVVKMRKQSKFPLTDKCVLVSQSCLTLCDPMDCSPPGSPVHRILQARTLEWVAIPFSR